MTPVGFVIYPGWIAKGAGNYCEMTYLNLQWRLLVSYRIMLESGSFAYYINGRSCAYIL